jgi:hypothetical protein
VLGTNQCAFVAIGPAYLVANLTTTNIPLLVRNLNQKCTHVGTTTNNIKLVRAIICAQAIFKHPTAEGHIFHVAVCKRLSKMSFCSKKKPEFPLTDQRILSLHRRTKSVTTAGVRPAPIFCTSK